MPQTELTPYESALKLAEHGWYVFPADHPDLPQCVGVQTAEHNPATCDKRGKHPAIKWDTGASTSPDNIHYWWSGNPRNAAIHCGKSGLLVIDEDAPDEFAKYAADHGVTIPDTYTVTTAQGKHYYFQDTEAGALGNREGAFGEYHINIRSGRGYVIAAGSKHESGTTYTANGVRTVAPLPGWVRDAIKGNGRDTSTDAKPNGTAFELPDVIKEGHRDEILYRFALSLRSQDLNMNTALMLMKVAWEKCEQPPKAGTRYDWQAAVTKLHGAYGRYDGGRSEEYQKAQTDKARRLVVTTAIDIPMKATRWLWEDDGDHWLPMGELAGLAGRAGVGKSTWCAHLTALVTNGKLPGDYYGTPKDVIICTTEDDWNSTLRPRLEAAGADLTKVHRVEAVDADGLEGIVKLPTDLADMERIIREKDVALVILDPLLTFVDKQLDTHKDAEVRRALEPVVKIAHDTKSSVIGLIHVNKTTDGDLMNRVMGSRAIGAVARGVLFCARYLPIDEIAEDIEDADPEPKRARFMFGQIKNNLQAKVMRSVEYHMHGKVVGFDEEAQKNIEGSYVITDGMIPENIEDLVLAQEKVRKSGKSTEKGKALTWLLTYLKGKGEVPSHQIISDGILAGHGRNAVQNARQELGEAIEVRNIPGEYPRRSTWKLSL
jgi:hypothetical protein